MSTLRPNDWFRFLEYVMVPTGYRLPVGVVFEPEPGEPVPFRRALLLPPTEYISLRGRNMLERVLAGIEDGTRQVSTDASYPSKVIGPHFTYGPWQMFAFTDIPGIQDRIEWVQRALLPTPHDA